jgi:hypothetical protein
MYDCGHQPQQTMESFGRNSESLPKVMIPSRGHLFSITSDNGNSITEVDVSMRCCSHVFEGVLENRWRSEAIPRRWSADDQLHVR